MLWLSWLVSAAACAHGGAGTAGDGAQPTDAPPGHDGAGGHDAPVSADAPQSHDAPAPKPMTLLLSEVMLGPTGGEFIEIVNPTSAAVDLSTYYLADRNDYYKLPGGALTAVANDFIVKFPASSSLAAGGVVTVAVGTATAFHNTTSVNPTYSITDGTMALAGATSLIGSQPGLTDAGELIVLFQWNGTSDLVKDVDLFIAGSPSVANGLASKSQVAQGASTYLVDVDTLPTQSAPAPGTSTKRILLETGHENQNGNGNGITGDDETSENTALTWDQGSYTGPTPGAVPSQLLL